MHNENGIDLFKSKNKSTNKGNCMTSGVIQGWHVPEDSPSPIKEFGKVRVIPTFGKDGGDMFASVKFDLQEYPGGVTEILVTDIRPAGLKFKESDLLFDVVYWLKEEYGQNTEVDFMANAIKV